MKVRVENQQGTLNLTKRDFIASGGEGSVYAKGGMAYKIYNDPKRMIPIDKIRELQRLQHPNIIKPEAVIYDPKDRPIGYAMRYLSNTHPLCKVFTKAFKVRQGMCTDDVMQLVRDMGVIVQSIHEASILVVDLNELNFLLDEDCNLVFAIDVDSYQTPHFPATAIMTSVKDHHTKGFNEGSDWFSWGVVTFQMLIGIHPYKGKHPDVSGLEERMRKNLSVFSPFVSVPKMCPRFDIMPQELHDWYLSVFEKGDRTRPPFDSPDRRVQAAAAPRVTKHAGDVYITPIGTVPGEVVFYYKIGRGEAAIVDDGGPNLLLQKRWHWALQKPNLGGDPVPPDARLVITPKLEHEVTAVIRGGMAELRDIHTGTPENIEFNVAAEDLMVYDNRLYLKRDEVLMEVEFIELATGKIYGAAAKVVGNVMNKATTLYDGVVVQNMLGDWHITICPESGKCYTVKIPELKGYRVVDAKFDSGVLMVVGHCSKGYDEMMFIMNPDYSSYSVGVTEDINFTGINFVVLDNGVGVRVTDDEKLELFRATAIASGSKIVEDPIISADMKLWKRGSEVVFSKGGVIALLSTKKK